MNLSEGTVSIMAALAEDEERIQTLIHNEDIS
jgi:hypothetical protein